MIEKQESSDPIEVFISYSHKDEELCAELRTHLKILKRQGVISEWHDREIPPGAEWQPEISFRLNTAHIILLLVSADFLASDYSYDVEMTRALERHANGEAYVIPIILRPCKWKKTPFGRLEALPNKAKPVIEWSSPDAAFLNVVEGIDRIVEDILKESGGLSSDWVRSLILRKKVVRHVQKFLKDRGYYTGGIHGIPGPNTHKGVRRFQEANGLKADGLIGPETLNKILELQRKKA